MTMTMMNDLVPRDDIHFANVNNAHSKKNLIRKAYKELVSQNRLRHLLLSIATCSYHAFTVKAEATQYVKNQLAKRKLDHVKRLQWNVERLREQQKEMEPRQAINEIFMQIQSVKSEEGEQGVEFRKIYSPHEILLFITSPPKATKFIKIPKALAHNDEYIRLWKGIRKRAKQKQFHQINEINNCYNILKEEYNITTDAINDRIHRTKIAKNHPSELSKLSSLLDAFQEIVLAFQDLEELSRDDPPLYNTLSYFRSLETEDIDMLEHFAASEKLPKDLPPALRKTIIKIANQTDIIEKISKLELGHMCELILDSSQWNCFLTMQSPSKATLKVLDWAYHETWANTSSDISFTQSFENCASVLGEEGKYAEIIKAAEDKNSLSHMCSFFANEIHREWPSIILSKEGKESYFTDRLDDAMAENVLELFHALQEVAELDDHLLLYLQGAVSQKGRTLLQSRLKEEFEHLLGEPSQYFVPVFDIAHIAINVASESRVEVTYYFRQRIFRKSEETALDNQQENAPIMLLLQKDTDRWFAIIEKQKIS